MLTEFRESLANVMLNALNENGGSHIIQSRNDDNTIELSDGSEVLVLEAYVGGTDYGEEEGEILRFKYCYSYNRNEIEDDMFTRFTIDDLATIADFFCGDE